MRSDTAPRPQSTTRPVLAVAPVSPVPSASSTSAAASPEASALVDRATEWLVEHFEDEVQRCLDDEFYRTLDENERDLLFCQNDDVIRRILDNSFEWVLANGKIATEGVRRPALAVALEGLEALANPAGALQNGERILLEELGRSPLRLYEVASVSSANRDSGSPVEIELRDLLEGASTWSDDVLSRSTGLSVIWTESLEEPPTAGDLLAARIVEFDLGTGPTRVLSGAVYPFDRLEALHFLVGLAAHPEEVADPSTVERRLVEHWLWSLQPPQLTALWGEEEIELPSVYDHYEVLDAEALDDLCNGPLDIPAIPRTTPFDQEVCAEFCEKHPGRFSVFCQNFAHADALRRRIEDHGAAALRFVTRRLPCPEQIDERLLGQHDSCATFAPLELEKVFDHQAGIPRHGWLDRAIPVLGNRSPREYLALGNRLHVLVELLHAYEIEYSRRGFTGRARRRLIPSLRRDIETELQITRN